MPSKIPDEHHIVRFCPKRVIERDITTKSIVGLFPQAFELRDGEEYLSNSYLEHFSDRTTPLKSVLTAFRSRPLNIKPKDALATVSVSGIHECARARDCSLRVLHEPEEFPDYATIRRLPQPNDLELCELLATVATLTIDEVSTI